MPPNFAIAPSRKRNGWRISAATIEPDRSDRNRTRNRNRDTGRITLFRTILVWQLKTAYRLPQENEEQGEAGAEADRP